MRFFPPLPTITQKLRKHIPVAILVPTGALLLLVILWNYYRVAKPATRQLTQITISTPTDNGCIPRTDTSGWSIVNNHLITYPRCLTVTNSRWGSRFNFDISFARNEVRSSIMGTLEDRTTAFNLNWNGEQLFPSTPLAHYSTTSTLTPTSQQLQFATDKATLTLTIISPFSPSSTSDDFAAQVSSAPFFYIDLTLFNATSSQQEQTVVFQLAQAKDVYTSDTVHGVYLSDTKYNHAVRALVLPKANEGEVAIHGNNAVFTWHITVQPKETKRTSLIYAGFTNEPVITKTLIQSDRENLPFTYTYFFKNINEVVNFAAAQEKTIRRASSAFDLMIQRQATNPILYWLLSQAFHSYVGNTWIVGTPHKNLEYLVWEGEFRYINTVDVAHDYAVLEGLYFPWVIKHELLSWEKSAKEDTIGTVVPHDLGIHTAYSGKQAYLIDGHETSGMPVEENLNYILLAYWYWYQTQDVAFIKQRIPFLQKLIASVEKRDTNGNGIVDTAIGMTTYDNDGNIMLKSAPDSIYLGIKQLAAELALYHMLQNHDTQAAEHAMLQAKMIADSLRLAYQTYGFIPLSLRSDITEPMATNQNVYGTQEQGIAAFSGLLYPALTNLQSDILTDLKPLLADSFKQAYQHSLVFDGNTPVGLQLAQFQGLSLGWLSHSVMIDTIANRLFGQTYQSYNLYFAKLYDNPHAYSDGQYFKPPYQEPHTTLLYYPRGAALFAAIAP